MILLLAACGPEGHDSPPKDTVADSEPTDPTETGDTAEPTVPPDEDWRFVDAVRITGNQGGDEAGYRLAIGDADADDEDELLVGTSHFAGPMWVSTSGSRSSGVFLCERPLADGVVDDLAVARIWGWVGGGFGTNAAVLGPGACGPGACVAVFGQGDDFDDLTLYAAPFAYDTEIDDAVAWIARDPDGAISPDLLSHADPNGDGVDDLVLPAYLADGNGGVLAWFGPLAGELSAAAPDLELYAPSSHGVGQGLERSDLDGDGMMELLVPATERNAEDGGVYLSRDTTGGRISLGESDAFWEGEGGQAGQSVNAGGDLDRDGHDDVYVGAPLFDERRGRAYVALDGRGGPLAEAPLRFDARHDHDFFGYSGAIADLDGDGQADLAIGVPRDPYSGFDRPGRVSIWLGPLSPGARTEDDANAIVYVGEAADSFGYYMRVGELDGDGVADLAVGAPQDSSHATQAGAISVLFGTTLFP